MEEKDEDIVNDEVNVKGKKKENKNNILMILIIIVLIISIGVVITYKFIINPKVEYKSGADVDSTEEKNEKDDSDILNYALLTYANGEVKYRLVEFHKNSKDKVLLSYDVGLNVAKDSIASIKVIGIMNNKLYYTANYAIDDGSVSTYANVMSIDLSKKDAKPEEVINWKQDDYSKTIMDVRLTDEYIYFSTMAYEENYKYSFKTKEITKMERDEYTKEIMDYYENNPKDTVRAQYYINNKELKISDDNQEVFYDGESIYKMEEKGWIRNLYSFDNDIVIQVATNCHSQGCENFEYFKYNYETKKMESQKGHEIEAYDISIIS